MECEIESIDFSFGIDAKTDRQIDKFEQDKADDGIEDDDGANAISWVSTCSGWPSSRPPLLN